jgi:hypothetical protein
MAVQLSDVVGLLSCYTWHQPAAILTDGSRPEYIFILMEAKHP